MALKNTSIEMAYLAKEFSLRSDINFILTDKEIITSKYYRFSDLFDIVNCKVDASEVDELYYVEIGNVCKDETVEPVFLSWSERNEFNDNYFKKIENGDVIKPNIGDILIAKVRPNLKKYILIDDVLSHYYYTSAFIVLRPKQSGKLLFYSLKAIFYKNLIAISRQGKGYPTISEKDLPFLKFEMSIIDNLFTMNKIVLEKIETIENTIKVLRSKIKTDQSVINKIFTREFNFNLSKFEKLKTVSKYYCDFQTYTNNYDIRNSVKFHRPAGLFVYEELTKLTSKEIKHFISEPIVLGASVSPTDFDDAGHFYYVSMASIKNLSIELDDSQLLSDAYISKKKNIEKRINKNDIIMSRSGVAIGKFALVENDIDAIFADFTMRIRLNIHNVKFAYYYFRTTYFQYLIEINKKGVQNQNIFPRQIQEFPMLDISNEQQDKIVEEIQSEICEQQEIKVKVRKLREKIDDIIRLAIKV